MTTPEPMPEERAIDCTQTIADSDDEAVMIAASCGTEVEIASERTPWETSWAMPSGEHRLEVSMVPTRTEVNGEWQEIDSSIVTDDSDGTLKPVAALFDVRLNPGGVLGENVPLGVIERDGASMAITFPLDLPVPAVDGSRAIYALDDGIRLIVTMFSDGSGFVPVIELESPAAAERLKELLLGTGVTFGLELSEGLRMESQDGGAVDVVDADGEAMFTAPPPVMWDSAGGDVEADGAAGTSGPVDRLMQAAVGDRVAEMGVSVTDNSMTVTIDEAMMSDPETVWPVHLDPGFSGKGPGQWLAVRTGAYTNTLYKWGDTSTTRRGEGDGRCDAYPLCPANWTQRLVWQYGGLSGIAELDGSDITSAKFRVNGWYSATCNPTVTELHAVEPISSATKWGDLHWNSETRISSRNEYHSAECGGQGYREFGALKALRLVADLNLSTITLGLKAQNETTINLGWKRFRADATLSVTYNRKPDTPSGVRVLVGSTNVGCATGADRPVISTTTPKISAIGRDPDGTSVKMVFRAFQASNGTKVWSPAYTASLPSGQRHTLQVASGNLVNGQIYRLTAKAHDPGGLESVTAARCEVEIDTSKPASPAITPALGGTGVQAVYRPDEERGGVGRTGRFTFWRESESDVVSFMYGFDDASMTRTVDASSLGKANVWFTPTASGPVTLYAASKDAAGNVSGTTRYTFDVAAPTEDAIWTLDEDADLTAEGTGESGERRPLTIDGATRPTESGPLALFGSRDGDQALVFDGVDDAAWTENGPVVDTTKSFAVSAHVWLDAADIDTGRTYTAVAQDGSDRSGFYLSYRPSCSATGGDAGSGCWTFRMSDNDGSGGGASPESPVIVRPDQWVHLLGEYDAVDKTSRLWVCEAGTPENPSRGEPIGPTEVTRTATPWAANGAFSVGRGLYGGAPVDWWPGKVDNIRVFSGEIVDEAKIRRLCQGAEATDFSTGDTALDPTEVED
ncbi:LamG-like jellyroll fold domain-containing protein [Microbacterium karelineae]|uniref:LamG-like jellyroll fold domain-containing protein n=1 Tax=Microbacterium karelineae TaxID=2654283 RepID=UPI0012EA113F|nr:LamG-like jellyroll fold domain-containing protein [Microbacterium karelineae]